MSLDASALKNILPLVRVPKPPTIHYQPATWKLFDSPLLGGSLHLRGGFGICRALEIL